MSYGFRENKKWWNLVALFKVPKNGQNLQMAHKEIWRKKLKNHELGLYDTLSRHLLLIMEFLKEAQMMVYVE